MIYKFLRLYLLLGLYLNFQKYNNILSPYLIDTYENVLRFDIRVDDLALRVDVRQAHQRLPDDGFHHGDGDATVAGLDDVLQ